MRLYFSKACSENPECAEKIFKKIKLIHISIKNM